MFGIWEDLSPFNLILFCFVFPLVWLSRMWVYYADSCGYGEAFFKLNLFLLLAVFLLWLILVFPKIRDRERLDSEERRFAKERMAELSFLFLLLSLIASVKAICFYFILFAALQFGQPKGVSKVLFAAVFMAGTYTWSLSGHVGAINCAKISSEKANMHTFQIIVETYGVDHRAVYPPNVAVLHQVASVKEQLYSAYWKDFSNPYTALSGKGKSYDDLGQYWNLSQPIVAAQKLQLPKTYMDFLGIRFYKPRRFYEWELSYEGFTKVPLFAQRGLVLYHRVDPAHYEIYGVGKGGEFVTDKGKPFVLTNS